MKLRNALLATAVGTALGAPALAQQTGWSANQQWSPTVVRQAEQALKSRNFITGPVDGIMDPKTYYGIRQLQRSRNLAVTGGLNMETLAALNIEQSQYGPQARSFGAQPQLPPDYNPGVVRSAEQALADKNFVTGPIDGRLDAQTRYGLRQFQRGWNLADTGSLNMETLEALGIEPSQYSQAARESGAGAGGTAGGYRQGYAARSSAGGSASGGATGATGPYVVDETLYTPEIIRAVEQSLKDKNFITGPVNGEIEMDTQYGLQQFQRTQRLAPTGNLNFETLSALGIDVTQRSR